MASATITPDEASNAAGGILDSLFGTANSAVDVWNKWQAGKTANVAAKAAIPSSTVVANPATGASGLNSQSLLIIGGGALALLLTAFLVFRKK